MTLLAIKLIADDAASDLQTAIDAFLAGAGSGLLTAQRGMDVAAYFDPQDDKNKFFCALAYSGEDTPASKTANQQFIVVEGQSLAAVQTALNAALAVAKHAQVTDGVTSVAGTLTTATGMFASEDVGRKIRIIESGVNQDRVIATYSSANSVTYTGTAFVSGTGKTVALLGAEVLQGVEVTAFRERDGDPHFSVLAAVEGQIA